MALEGRSPTRSLTLVTLCVLMFVGADYVSHGAVRGTLRAFVQPIVTTMHGVRDAIAQNEFWKTHAALREEVQRLSKEVERAQGTQAALEAVTAENEILRALARVAEHTRGVTVPLISSFASSPYGTFVIGGGSNQGIQVGDIAIAGDGFVLGSVTDVSQETAVVSSVFSPGVQTEVMVDDVAFSLSGRGGGNARADVPRELPLTVGSPVLAPRFANRVVGVIGRIESASSSAFSDVYVSFPYNLNALRFVFVTHPL